MSVKKSILSLLSIMLIMLLLTACSESTTQIINQADEAFDAKNYTEFNSQFSKLTKKDNVEATNYLNKIKGYYLVESIINLEDSIAELAKIELEIPSLSEYAKSQKDVLNSELVTLKAVEYILNEHVLELEKPTSPANDLVILMDELEDVEVPISTLETLSTGINVQIIEIGSLSNVASDVSGLLQSMSKHKQNLDAKINYLDTNLARITSSNKLSLEGNIFALSWANEITRDMKSIDNEIITSLSDLKQRAIKLDK